MLTCHALYYAGIQPLVRLPITLDSDDDTIAPFHDFMLSHSPASFLAFRELHIVSDDLGSGDTKYVIELLKRGTRLRRIKLPYFILYNNEGSEAVGCLKKLEELDIGDGYYDGIDRVLTRLHSPLAKINIQLDCVDYVVGEIPILDPVLLLANFQNTLERATITSFPFSTVNFCYPKLLDLELHLYEEPSLSVLVTAFPNLQTLLIDSYGGMEDQDLTDLRNQNMAFQDGHKCWESLTSVTADPGTLYGMGLRNTLKSVTITHIRELTSVRLSFLRVAISTTKTEALSLHLRHPPCSLSEVLSGVGNSLVSLELTVQIYEKDGHEKTLASRRLLALSLRIWLTAIHSARTSWSKSSLPSPPSCFI